VRGPLAWSMSTDASAKAATLVTTFVAIRALAPRQFGQVVGLYAVALLAASLWDLGVSSLLTREIAAERLRPMDALLGALRLRSKAAPIWLVCFAAGALILGRQGSLPLTIIVAFALDSILFATHALLLAILRGGMHFAAAGLASASGRWVTAAIAVSSFTGANSSQRLTIIGLAYAMGDAFTLYLAFRWARRIGQNLSPRTASISLRQAIPFGANGILNIAYNRFDVVILAALASAGQLAFYAPASRVQDALYLIPSSLGLVALPLLSQAISRGSGAAIEITRRATLLGLGLAIPTTLIVFALTPQLIAIVLGPSYEGAVASTRILIWSLPMAVVQAPLIAEIAARGHAAETTKIYVSAFVVAAVMHASLDWWLGATGAAIASLSREPVALIVALALAWRIRRAFASEDRAQVAMTREATL
jgi:O-antigen/teichoic acid export membrane protein